MSESASSGLSILKALEPALTQIFKEGVEGNFTLASGPEGPWPPRVDDEPHPLLHQDGNLLKAATEEMASSPQVAEDSITWVVPTTSGYPSVEYAYVHNFGERTPFGGGRRYGIPQREFFYASEDTINKMEQEVASALEHILFD